MSALQIRIGTRASKLALWQAQWVAKQLRRQGATVELVEMVTRGDTDRRGPIIQLGLQGVFTKEIQSAVLKEQVDVAVHSLKDLPTDPTAGLVLAAVPERENVADALITGKATSLASLPQAARVGTGSLRRQSQLKSMRPDLAVASIRGNVDTRLRKLDAGEYDAIILAAAGLHRLGLGDRITELLQPPRMLPAPGQGALGIECRVNDLEVRAILSHLDDPDSRYAIEAERSMLAMLHGGCSAPVGAWARLEGGQLTLEGLVANLEGMQVLRATAKGDPATASDVGHRVAEHLLDQGAAEIIATARGS